jgi:SAM-dependent methyltransferase
MGGGASTAQPVERSRSMSVLVGASSRLVPRRPPLKTAAEIFASNEARIRVEETVQKLQLTEKGRWQKICNIVNVQTEPSDKEPDPLRIEITVPVLKEVLKMVYSSVSAVIADGIVQMRQHFPTLYKKHTIKKGKVLSQTERDKRGLSGDCWSYGELEHEIFATIFEKISKAYGRLEDGSFYDLGCGAGQLVYAAAFIGNFKKCCGIEYITALLERGEKKTNTWNQIKTNFPPEYKVTTTVRWRNDNLFETSDWADGTFYVLHWTAFNEKERDIISKQMLKCKEGAIVITFTHKLPENHFEVLVEDICRVSWGESDFFVQLKSTPSIE